MYDHGPYVLRILLRILARCIDTLIVLGPSIAEALTKRLGSRRIRVVPNGVPEPLVLAPWIKGDPSVNPDISRPLRLVFLSNLMETKGVYDLLAALRLVREDGYAVVATIVGTDVDGTAGKARLKATALGISDIVTLSGPLTGSSKWDLLARSHVFALPSWDEGQPLAVLEAMAVGLPVISTTVGAIPDAVQDGVNGYLVPPRSPMLLADAIARFARDPDSVSRMGRESRRLYQAFFQFEEMVQRLVEVMHEVMAQEWR
jgi:glycosyltransferase involved in cell wall biosynthesis